MPSEIGLKKIYDTLPGASYIIDDVNEAQRRFFLSQVLIVIPCWNNFVTTATTEHYSEILEIPGRTHFNFEFKATGAASCVFQGSLTKDNWNDIATIPLTSSSYFSSSIASSVPYRFYRLKLTSAAQQTISLTFAAIKI